MTRDDAIGIAILTLGVVAFMVGATATRREGAISRIEMIQQSVANLARKD